jgi:Membrane-bound serine protease (ClpP class)
MKNRALFISFFVWLCTFSFAFCKDTVSVPSSSAAQRKVVVIPVEGDVDPTMAAFLSRALREAEKYPDPLILLEMDTFGGRVDAAFQIVDTILNVQKGTTIAYVKTKAISAGSLIALSCGRLVMKHNTTIGDCAPIAISGEGAQMLGEKFQSPLRAKFRTLAKKNGFPQILAEALVTPDLQVYKVTFPDTVMYLDSVGIAALSKDQSGKIKEKKTVVQKGQLLTMDDVEAKQLGFSKMSVSSVEEMLSNMHISNFEIIRIKENWSEGLVKFISLIAPFLLMIGFASLYIEYKTPGLIVPGIIGALCLGLVFFGQYMVGLGTYTELLLIILGVVLLGLEIFVLPGLAIAGIVGTACIIIGIILSFQDFVIPSPSMPWQAKEMTGNIGKVIGSFFVAFIGGISFIRFALPSFSKVVKGPYLEASLKSSHADSEAIIGVNEGDEGVVVMPLRPSGRVSIGSRTFDVVTEGGFIEKGAQITVIKISRSKITVSRKKENA